MEYEKTRAIAEELAEYADHLEGSWTVETGDFRRYGKAGDRDGG
ncbi:hypothetical protein [Streptomyces beihaiensis]|uniref:Uncharacterized protein n=1 Tax=Streptomyces beihaiensis TaxID=2984495 RepID=A0ABT3TY71_9ACTN|nr:hypothetical protein [Streptomyces beihaiensis]MCX3061015.1 hypothetical protein [Streptomyces beihaiensis]